MVYPIFKRTIGFYFRIYIKKVNGAENLPQHGHFIIASNHESHADSFLLIPFIVSHLDRKIFFLTRFGSTETDVGLLSKLTLFITKPLALYWFGCIPVLKKGKAVEACVKFLKKGKIIGIYPEGKRNPSKTLLHPRTGVAAMALLAKVPVVPVGIINSYRILPIGKMVPRFKRAIINIGKPIYFNQYYGKSDNKEILRKVTDDIMVEIAKLCGKKYH